MERAVPELRAFNRFYTRFAGALDAHFLGSAMSLPEVRLLYEIATRDAPLAIELQDALGLDAGYASRILRRFENRGWIERGRGADARQRPILLTEAGHATFAELDRVQQGVVERQLAPLGATDRASLIAALGSARSLLSAGAGETVIRTFRAGDMGTIAARQAILYGESNGWGTPMEALVLDVTAQFLRAFQPGREQCWVAERGGVMAGSVFVADAGDGVAQLRLLYVEPFARGAGIGAELVARCIAFAREAGYDTLRLWTHTVLESARRIYAGAGMRIVSVDMHDAFGKPEQGEIWEMPLDA